MGRPATKALPVVTALLVAVLLAGCGGSSPAQSAAARERSEEAQSEAKLQRFAKCLREHGLNAEVRSSPGEGSGLRVSPGKEGSGEPESAESACARYRPEPKHVDLSPQQQVEHEEAVQKFARCMREHGVKVEASAKGGGIQIEIHRGSGPNPRSPSFRRAQAACQKLLPGPGPGSHKAGAAATGAGG